jgi:hypothetical protein
VWLITLFTPADEAESMLGDLLEEFSQLASKSGVAFARGWYWRQTVKTIAHLTGSGFRSAPWTTVAAVAGGFLLIRFGLMFYGQAIETVLDRYRFYEYVADLGRQQPSVNVAAAYMYWINRGMMLGRLLVLMMAGGIVAGIAKGREMTATIALGLCMAALGINVSLVIVARTGHYAFLFLWALPGAFAAFIAIVAGGVIVRARRSAAAARPFAT